MIVNEISEIGPQLANCRDYWLGWGAEDRVDGDLTYFRSGLADPVINGVMRLADADRAEEAIRRAADALAGVPWAWRVGPDSDPGVVDALADHGATRLDMLPVMAVRMDRLAEIQGPAALKIETVEGADALAEWVRTYAPAFEIAPEIVDGMTRIEAGRADNASIVRVVARLDGEAVATALLYEAHGVAGIYNVATAEAHRGRGIGAVVTAAALRVGRDRGLRVGTLQASSVGARLYRRMGFHTVGAYQLFQVPTP